MSKSEDKVHIFGSVVNEDDKGISDALVEVWDTVRDDEVNVEGYEYPLGSQLTNFEGSFHITLSKNTLDKIGQKLGRELKLSFKIFKGKKGRLSFLNKLLKDTSQMWYWTPGMNRRFVKIRIGGNEFQLTESFCKWFDTLLLELDNNYDDITEDLMFEINNAVHELLETVNDSTKNNHYSMEDIQENILELVVEDKEFNKGLASNFNHSRKMGEMLKSKMLERLKNVEIP